MADFNELATEHLKVPAGEIRDDLTPKDVPGWDSMNYLLFISELEQAYGVSFSMDEILQAKTLGEVKNALRSKGIQV